MNKSMTQATLQMLSFREELEIGIMIASDEAIVDYVLAGRLDTSEIRSTLREVVQEVGVGYTDRQLTELIVARLQHNLAGRF
jgi:hypothetical protein